MSATNNELTHQSPGRDAVAPPSSSISVHPTPADKAADHDELGRLLHQLVFSHGTPQPPGARLEVAGVVADMVANQLREIADQLRAPNAVSADTNETHAARLSDHVGSPVTFERFGVQRHGRIVKATSSESLGPVLVVRPDDNPRTAEANVVLHREEAERVLAALEGAAARRQAPNAGAESGHDTESATAVESPDAAAQRRLGQHRDTPAAADSGPPRTVGR